LNIRYTGLQAYSIIEGYERVKAGMRLYRRVSDPDSYGFSNIASLYSAMPLHDSIHHDGWSGENPKGYTRDPEIHGRFESNYVDLIGTAESDVLKYIPRDARYLEDPWQAALNHSLDARNFVEDIYRLDLRGAFRNKDDQEAREMVYKRIAAGATFLRDLAYTAWIESAKPVPQVKPIDQPHNPENPRFNPAAGSAPAPPHQ